MKYVPALLPACLLLASALAFPAHAGPKKPVSKKPAVKVRPKKAAPKPPAESTLPPMISEDELNVDGTPKPRNVPTLPANFAVRASFELKNGATLTGAPAFAVTVDGKPPVLLLPLNVFGWGGGLTTQIPPDKLPALLASVKISTLDGATSLGTAGRPLLRDGKPTQTGFVKWADVSEDLAAFALPENTQVAALPLAEFSARQGERVWIVGKRPSEPGATPFLFGGTVAEDLTTLNTGVGQAVTMDDPSERWTTLDGAPVVDKTGHVIGMFIAGLQIIYPGYDPNKVYAAINPVRRLRRMLSGIGAK